MSLLRIALAGGGGSAARFVLDGAINRRFATSPFPPGIVVVNILGSFLLGVIIGVSARGLGLSPQVAGILGAGLCSGFTTFSTASVEAVHLWVDESRRAGLAYVCVTLLGSLLAAAIGLEVARLF